jgi:molybdate transport system substrate-binding protein
VKKIAIANPKLAPYGQAAEEAMKRFGVYDAAKDRLVLGDNIAQTAQFVESGAADIGILALSLALAPEMKEKGRYWEIPADAYPPIEQAGVVVSWAKDDKAARTLQSFITGPEARQILADFGYRAPGKP